MELKKRRILINGTNSKVGGGKSILNNYLSILSSQNRNEHYFLLCPVEDEYTRYESEFITIIPIKSVWKLGLLFPVLYWIVIPNLIRKYKIDTVLNLGDIPLRVKVKQVYLFDWAYAVYPEYLSHRWMDVKNLLIRKLKFFFLTKNLRFPTRIVAQSPTMRKRLESLYGLNNILVVPNAVSVDNLSGGEYKNYSFPEDKIKFLYLTHYYTHKNLEIFIPLAFKIKELNLPYIIVITLDRSQHARAGVLLDNIKSKGLDDIIVNVGPVQLKHVPGLYAQCDCLLMPTLLESFSGTCVEAMYHRKVIFTSDRDFIADVCGDAAFYFDPLDASSILNTIVNAFDNHEMITEKVELGSKRLKEMKGWDIAFTMYQELLIN